jgi:hypothetical protein
MPEDPVTVVIEGEFSYPDKRVEFKPCRVEVKIN